jgi:hypothetical protein
LLAHTNTSVLKGESVSSFIGDDVDFEGRLVLGDIRVGKRFVSDFVKSVGGIGDKFSEEDLFVGVEGVDDESHKLLDVSIESEMFFLLTLSHDVLYGFIIFKTELK